jgi:hypothetical protein
VTGPAVSLAWTLPDPVLRLVCQPVDAFDRPFRELVEEMRQLMLRHRGIGLAAPQAGASEPASSSTRDTWRSDLRLRPRQGYAGSSLRR